MAWTQRKLNAIDTVESKVPVPHNKRTRISGKHSPSCDEGAPSDAHVLGSINLNKPGHVCKFCHSRDSEALGNVVEVPHKIGNSDKVHKILAHLLCVTWCPRVTQSADNTYRNVQIELARASKLSCTHCKKKGAAIGCSWASEGERVCGHTYHLACAQSSQCSVDMQKFLVVCASCKPSSLHCYKCNEMGDIIMCCDGCENAAHASCVGLGEIPEGDWFCGEKGCAGEAVASTIASPAGGGDGCSQGSKKAVNKIRKTSEILENLAVMPDMEFNGRDVCAAIAEAPLAAESFPKVEKKKRGRKPKSRPSISKILAADLAGVDDGDAKEASKLDDVAEVLDSTIPVDTIVEGNYLADGIWFRGKILVNRGNGTYDILYDDGETESEAKSTCIRLLDEPSYPRLAEEEVLSGRFFDFRSLKDHQWYAAKAVEGGKPGQARFRFRGWKPAFDEFFNICDIERLHFRIAPVHTFTKAPKERKPAEEYKELRKIRAEEERKLAEEQKAATLRFTLDEAEVVEQVTKSGRSVSVKVVQQRSLIRKRVDGEETFPRDRNDDLCGLCDGLTGGEDCWSELVCCDGPCLRSFHMECLHMNTLPEEETWLCDDCSSGSHACFQCAEHGSDGIDGGVYPCSQKSCGKFYHLRCVGARLGDDSISDVFVCPAHVCDVCKESGKSRGTMFRHCFKCPTGYHDVCEPPSAKSSELALLCSKHAQNPLPYNPSPDDEYCSVSAEGTSSIFPALPLPRNGPPLVTNASSPFHFRFPFSVLQEVESKPPVFRKLSRNAYLCHQTKINSDDQDKCKCVTSCDSKCVNFNLHIECDSKICNLNGNDCGNRSFANQHKRAFKVKPFRTLSAGWALKATEDIRRGAFLMEYMGEVISEEIYDQRMKANKESNEVNYYIMQLTSDTYIDAAHAGNLSRFMNHSCGPNVQTETWTVSGEIRIAFRTLRDIAAGEELTYDYRFFSAERLKCHCGARSCRGYLGANVHLEIERARVEKLKEALLTGDTETMNTIRNQFSTQDFLRLKKEVAVQRKKRSELREKEDKDLKKRQTCTASTLPGDVTLDIAKGPFLRHRSPGEGVFLWRTVMKGGSDDAFLSRFDTWKRGKAACRSKNKKSLADVQQIKDTHTSTSIGCRIA